MHLKIGAALASIAHILEKVVVSAALEPATFKEVMAHIFDIAEAAKYIKENPIAVVNEVIDVFDGDGNKPYEGIPVIEGQPLVAEPVEENEPKKGAKK